MEDSHKIIVIGRSFGSGGRRIGKRVGHLLGIPFYDRELLQEASAEYGYSRKVFALADEKKPSLLKRFVTQSYGVQETYQPDAFSVESLYAIQSKVIREIARKGPCVIVGRTADYILRDFEKLLSVFIHAPIDFRARNALERGDAENMERALEITRKIDREREHYYNSFSGRKWGMASNYHLSLDAAAIGDETAARIIADIYDGM